MPADCGMHALPQHELRFVSTLAAHIAIDAKHKLLLACTGPNTAKCSMISVMMQGASDSEHHMLVVAAQQRLLTIAVHDLVSKCLLIAADGLEHQRLLLSAQCSLCMRALVHHTENVDAMTGHHGAYDA